MNGKKPKSGLSDIDTEADAERLKAHLKHIDDLAPEPKSSEGAQPNKPPRSEDESAPD
jgi:hypothetical protein